MPRGVQKTDEERLEIVEREIATMEERKAKIQNAISDLNSQKKEILKDIRLKKLEQISQVLDETGKSPDDVLELLKA
jgi:predicted nuclease with TOPRIM domain